MWNVIKLSCFLPVPAQQGHTVPGEGLHMGAMEENNVKNTAASISPKIWMSHDIIDGNKILTKMY